MSAENINNLVELFFINYKRQKKDNILLTSLKDTSNCFTWEKTFHSIKKLSSEIKKYVNKGDRCLLISENRPEWFITDISVMLSEAITVPAYTTYAEKDYEYIIENCNPKLIFVSNQEQFNKVKDIIKNKTFITKIFFEFLCPASLIVLINSSLNIFSFNINSVLILLFIFYETKNKWANGGTGRRVGLKIQ